MTKKVRSCSERYRPAVLRIRYPTSSTFFTPDPGSAVEKESRARIRDRDPGRTSRILFLRTYFQFFWVKTFKHWNSLMWIRIRDLCQSWIRDVKNRIRDKQPRIRNTAYRHPKRSLFCFNQTFTNLYHRCVTSAQVCFNNRCLKFVCMAKNHVAVFSLILIIKMKNFFLQVLVVAVECGYLYIIIHTENSYMYLS